MSALLDDTQQSTSDTQGSKHWKIRLLNNNQQKSVEIMKVIHNLQLQVNSMLSVPAVDEMWTTDQDEKTTCEPENRM